MTSTFLIPVKYLHSGQTCLTNIVYSRSHDDGCNLGHRTLGHKLVGVPDVFSIIKVVCSNNIAWVGCNPPQVLIPVLPAGRGVPANPAKRCWDQYFPHRQCIEICKLAHLVLAVIISDLLHGINTPYRTTHKHGCKGMHPHPS